MILNFSKLPTLDVFLKKLFIIPYAGVINYLIVAAASKYIDKYVSVAYDKKKSKMKNIFNLSKIVGVMVIIYYIIRNFMEIIPYPFHDPPNFDVYRVKAISGTIVTAFAYLTYLGDDLISYKKLFDDIFP
tara:strand:- start:233 stop:622 length:390 start_codon:yes stop_codon:yes gene_type:complete